MRLGLFDSGIGGLTVAHQVKRLMPNLPIVYVGDTARMPWGVRSPEIVIEFASELIRFLEKKNVSHIVVACHTASAVALPELKRLTKVPLTGVIEPTVNKVVETTKGKVAIIATPTTVESHAWKKAIENKQRDVEIVEIAAPLLVPIVEGGLENHQVARIMVEEYTKDVKDRIDTLVLACTHYPLLVNTFQELLPDITVINPGKETAEYLKNILNDKTNTASISDEFYFTDLTPKATAQITKFYGSAIPQINKISVDQLKGSL